MYTYSSGCGVVPQVNGAQPYCCIGHSVASSDDIVGYQAVPYLKNAFVVYDSKCFDYY